MPVGQRQPFHDPFPHRPDRRHRRARRRGRVGPRRRSPGRALTGLLKEHITGAVALLQAPKSGDADAIAKAKTAWYANANEIADFLAKANPRNWPRREMRTMMRVHLDQTLKEAVDQLNGRYAASVADYDSVHRHILDMADGL